MKVFKISEGANQTEFAIDLNEKTNKYEFKVNGMVIAEHHDYEAIRALAMLEVMPKPDISNMH